MKKILIILIMGLNVSSCTFSQKPFEKQKDIHSIMNESLERDNYVIPDSLFSFFPNKSTKYKELKIVEINESAEKSEIPLVPSRFSPTELTELYQCDNKDYLQKLMKEYRLQSKYLIRSESKDYFVLGSEREICKEYDTLQLKERYARLNDTSLIFYFKESFRDTPSLYDTTTLCGLPLGYEIVVLKTGSNFVLPQDRKYEWSILPEHLKHGYRSGVAFKEGEPYIVYWTLAW